MVKRILISAAFALMIFAPAAVYAANGDIAGPIYTTDILTEVDGVPIESYSLNGETLIALEDLKDYGFEVYYNDNVRSLFVTKTGTADPSFSPSVERGKVGSTAGYYYESDIRAYINGREIEAYSLDGKMAAKVELIGYKYSDGSRPFYCGYSYDNSQRLLSLYTDPSEYSSFDNTLNNMFDTYTGLRDFITYMHTDDFWFINRFTGGIMGGGAIKNYHAIYKNGLMVNLASIFPLYYINPGDFTLSPDGETLYLTNVDFDGNIVDYKQVDLSNLHIFPADKSEFDLAASAYSDTGYTYTLNGVEIPVYTIGCIDYLRLADFDKCGFVRYDYNDKKIVTLTYSEDEITGGNIEKIDLTGTLCDADPNWFIYINGTRCDTDYLVSIDGELFIRAEALASPTSNGKVIINPYINYFAHDSFCMLSRYNAENKTAELYFYSPDKQDIENYIQITQSRMDRAIYSSRLYYTLIKNERRADNGDISYTPIVMISNQGIVTEILSLALNYIGLDNNSTPKAISCSFTDDCIVTITFSNGKTCNIDAATLKITE